jgi:hypothetical protein
MKEDYVGGGREASLKDLLAKLLKIGNSSPGGL